MRRSAIVYGHKTALVLQEARGVTEELEVLYGDALGTTED